MFERGKKSDDTFGSQETYQRETKSSAEAPKASATGRSRDVAVIGRSIQINGDLRGNEDLRIEGDVSGTVKLENSALTIGKGGKVKADVYAKSIAVDGETTGDLHATECVSVHANAKVKGNIIAPRVSIVEGAHFKGSIEMDPKAVDKALGSTATQGSKETASTKAPATAADAKTATEQPAKDAKAATHPQAKSA